MLKPVSLTLTVLVLIALLALAGCSLQKDDAKTRVQNVLNGLMKDDMSTEYQLGACQWFDGSYTMSQSDLEPTMDKFEAWLRQKSIKAPVGGYTIEKVTVEPGAAIPTSVVDVTIDGRPLQIRVLKGQEMQWAGGD